VLLFTGGRLEEGEEELRRAVAALDGAPGAATTELRLLRAGARGNLGSWALTAGRFAEAEEEYRRAILIQSELVRDFPNVPEYLLQRVMIQYNLGLGLARAGRTEEAERAWREALPHAERLASEFPAVARHRTPQA
jgi:tetratricopeptide (TPR) repeat protein